MTRHITGRIVLFFGILLAVPMSNSVCAQEFKLSSLFPFKKQKQEVKPFQLTDQSRVQPGLLPNRPVMNFFYPDSKPRETTNVLNDFSQKSKGFFARTGEGISNFSSDLRTKLKNMESPGWQSDKKTHWWNDDPDVDQLNMELNQLNMRGAQPNWPPQPQPRMAQELQTNPPRHRF